MLRGWLSVAVLLAVVLQGQTADKYTDKNRPYEFGFRIGEEQHRHEKKDENGIIEGEFGFLTADGVYHVTVYATDENGNFKIVSMKNIRVHPYPGTTTPEKKGHSLPFPPSENPPQTQRPPAPQPVPQVPGKTCSSCRLAPPTTAKPLLTDIAVVSRDQNNLLDTHNYQDPPRQQVPPTDFNQNNPPPQFNSSPIQSPGQTLQAPFSNPAAERNPKRISNTALQQGLGPKLENNLEQPQPETAQGPIKPTLISAQMQIVDKNTDVYYKKPGEKEGLPPGLSKDDMLQLLYTFNYTVGFHGHFEEGYSNGAKQGYYYITGRNGVRTRVDYVADEKGFRPKITQEVLDILSDDVPKPETEKDAKFGLKGYEFKWLYFPVGSKKR